jgi:hypothetical protein
VKAVGRIFSFVQAPRLDVIVSERPEQHGGEADK